MTIAEKLDRFIARYKPTLDWHPHGPMTWLAFSSDATLTARLVRRNGCWWLYTRRPDGAQAQAVKLHANITKAKRMAEAALAEPWLLDWPADGASRT